MLGDPHFLLLNCKKHNKIQLFSKCNKLYSVKCFVPKHFLTYSIIFYLRFFAKSHDSCPFPFYGVGENLAHAFFPEVGVVHFDDDETFTDGSLSGTNLFSVALHEIGHLLGLKHSQNTSAIMHRKYKAYDPNMKLTDDEKNGMDFIYGR